MKIFTFEEMEAANVDIFALKHLKQLVDFQSNCP